MPIPDWFLRHIDNRNFYRQGNCDPPMEPLDAAVEWGRYIERWGEDKGPNPMGWRFSNDSPMIYVTSTGGEELWTDRFQSAKEGTMTVTETPTRRSQELAHTLANDAEHWISIWGEVRVQENGDPPLVAQQDDNAPLSPRHCLWMCQRVRENAYTWPPSRSHCWIGFIHAGMIASGISDLEQLKTAARAIRQAFPEVVEGDG